MVTPSPTPTSSTPTPTTTSGEGGGHGGGGRSGGGPRFVAVANAAEARKYDFKSARPPGKKTNVLESVGHLVKSCLGGGVVGIHEAYKAFGLLSAVGLNVFLGILVAYVMMVLAHSAQKIYGRVRIPQMSFPDLAEATLDICPIKGLRKYSRLFRYLVDATIAIDLFGSCCCYEVIIARTLEQLFIYFDILPPWMNIRIMLICLLIPCILICMILTLKYLAPFSIVADIFIVSVGISTVIYGSKAATKSPTEFPLFKSLPGFFEYLGVCVFSMEGIGATLPIENNMEDPYKIDVVLFMGMGIVVSMVMTVGFFGYWGYGESAKAPITLNFGFDVWPTMLKFSMAIVIYVTFALNFWIPFNLVWVYIKPKYDPSSLWYVERIYRAIFVTVITAIAVTFPEVSKFMGLIGSFCLSNMGFIYPAFIALLLDLDDPGLGYMKWRFFRFLLLFIFGMILMVIGSVFNGISLLKAVGILDPSAFNFTGS